MFEINGYLWDIVYVDNDSILLLKPDGTYSVACVDSSVQVIYVSNNLYGEFLHKVLSHEITHCFAFSYGINMSYEEEERLCDFVATYGFEVVEMADFVYKMIKKVS